MQSQNERRLAESKYLVKSQFNEYYSIYLNGLIDMRSIAGDNESEKMRVKEFLAMKLNFFFCLKTQKCVLCIWRCVFNCQKIADKLEICAHVIWAMCTHVNLCYCLTSISKVKKKLTCINMKRLCSTGNYNKTTITIEYTLCRVRRVWKKRQIAFYDGREQGGSKYQIKEH